MCSHRRKALVRAEIDGQPFSAYQCPDCGRLLEPVTVDDISALPLIDMAAYNEYLRRILEQVKGEL